MKSAYYIAMRMVDDQEIGECSAEHSQTSSPQRSGFLLREFAETAFQPC